MNPLRLRPAALVGLALLWDASSVLAQPTIGDSGQPVGSSVSPGATAQFIVTAASYQTPLTYQWWFNGTPLEGKKSRALLLRNIEANQEGDYWVVLSDAAGSVTSKVARLEVDATFTKVLGRYPVADGDEEALSAKWSDLNGDGWLDLMVAGGMWSGGSPLMVYTNRGQGMFTRITTSPFSTSRNHPHGRSRPGDGRPGREFRRLG